MNKSHGLAIIQKGFTLVEIVTFIAVTAVVAGGLLVALNNVLLSSGAAYQLQQAASLARSRNELILNTRENGFASVNDPCLTSPLANACTPLITFATNNNLVVNTSITSGSLTRNINVTVTTATGNQYVLDTQVTNY